MPDTNTDTEAPIETYNMNKNQLIAARLCIWIPILFIIVCIVTNSAILSKLTFVSALLIASFGREWAYRTKQPKEEFEYLKSINESICFEGDIVVEDIFIYTKAVYTPTYPESVLLNILTKRVTNLIYIIKSEHKYWQVHPYAAYIFMYNAVMPGSVIHIKAYETNGKMNIIDAILIKPILLDKTAVSDSALELVEEKYWGEANPLNINEEGILNFEYEINDIRRIMAYKFDYLTIEYNEELGFRDKDNTVNIYMIKCGQRLCKVNWLTFQKATIGNSLQLL